MTVVLVLHRKPRPHLAAGIEQTDTRVPDHDVKCGDLPLVVFDAEGENVFFQYLMLGAERAFGLVSPCEIKWEYRGGHYTSSASSDHRTFAFHSSKSEPGSPISISRTGR